MSRSGSNSGLYPNINSSASEVEIDCPNGLPSNVIKPVSNLGETTVSLTANYYQPINTVISPTKLNKLIDSEIDFNDEKYDVHEEIKLNAEIQTSFSDPDFGTIPYLVILENGMPEAAASSAYGLMPGIKGVPAQSHALFPKSQSTPGVCFT